MTAEPVTGRRPRVLSEAALVDIDLERSALAACLVHPNLLDNCPLRTRDFASPGHTAIYNALLFLRAEGLDVGTEELRARLLDTGELERAGGLDYLLDLTGTIPPATLPLERLRKLALARELSDAARRLDLCVRARRDHARELEHMVALEAELRTIGHPEARLPSLADYVEAMRFDGLRLRTGLDTLDAATRGGIPTGRFIVIVGAPGSAKTTFGAWLCDTWQREGAAALYLAADEHRDGIVTRLGQLDGFPREGLESPHSTVRRAFAHKLRARPELMVVDPFDDRMTLEDAGALLLERTLDAREPRARVLIVDSLQTVPCAAAALAATQRERIDAIIETCKRIAKRGVIVVAISEMNRSGYRNGDRGLDASPLASGKDSSAIEYGGALLLALRSVRGESGVIDVDVAKNRIGSEKPSMRVSIDFERARIREVPLPPDASAQRVEKASERMERAKERIRATLREHRELRSRREVTTRTDGTTAHNLAAIGEMITRGEVVTVDGFLRLALGGAP